MPENFDNKRRTVVDGDRSFVIIGQTFTIKRRVRPDTLGLLSAIDAATGIAESLIAIDEMIVAMLVKADQPRWTLAREFEDEDGEQMIELDDMQHIIEWAVEKLTDRPLERPESSSDGSSTTAETSTAPALSMAAHLLGS